MKCKKPYKLPKDKTYGISLTVPPFFTKIVQSK